LIDPYEGVTLVAVMTTSARLRRVLFLFTIVTASCGLAFAQDFEAFHLKSGMTPEQVQKALPPPYELRWDKQQGERGWARAELAKPLSDVAGDDSDVYANVSFCDRRLVTVSRNIDADTDFAPYLEKWVRDFGQPKVSVRRDPWIGTGGGEATAVEFDWLQDGVKYTLMLTPEGRSGTGELRYSRGAAVILALEKYPCLKK
jgi:hypothetical protein